jgi:hypothetical protein
MISLRRSLTGCSLISIASSAVTANRKSLDHGDVITRIGRPAKL